MQLEKLEIESLIEEILLRYGYDFTGYARASFYRRIDRFMTNSVIKDGEALKKYIFTNPKNFEFFVQELTVNVTEMFRDPSYFLELRKKVIPMLSTYPHIKIWDAGCSTGEELFSLAILLKEENLLERTKIYATDLNQKVLLQAKEGIFPMISIPSYTQNYHKAGGKADFSDLLYCQLRECEI